MSKEMAWYVHKYGRLYTESEFKINRVKINLKVWFYNDKFYCELWQNNYLYYFEEVIE